MPGKPFIIAEAGVNHNGDPDLAFRLVEAASAAGADAVKFQTFRANDLVAHSTAKAGYQSRASGEKESQQDMLRRLELAPEVFRELRDFSYARGVEFMSTAFDSDSLKFLVEEIGVGRLKIGSGELTNSPFVLEHARANLPLIVSTGMSTLAEVEQALSVIAFGWAAGSATPPSLTAFMEFYASSQADSVLREKLTLLHCTTEYPAPMEQINLRAMLTLRDAFGLAVGYSDHSLGAEVSVAAVALGAVVIEKHLTLDRNLPGPDHSASMDAQQFKQLVSALRNIPKAMGNPRKCPGEAESRNIPVSRKVIVSARRIGQGEVFSSENMRVKRAGEGLSPQRYWDVLGRTARRSYSPDEPLEL